MTDGRGALETAPRRDTLVIGGSAGAISAVQQLLSLLPPELPATVLVALHRMPLEGSRLAEMLARGRFPARDAVDGDTLELGQVLLAPADRHLLVDSEVARVVRGPRECRARPAIDPLFRSAAVSRSTRVLATLVTGGLDDGTAGLAAVKRCGGTVLVQDPDDAEYPDMPSSALRYVSADHVGSIPDLAAMLSGLTGAPAPPPVGAPEDLRAEMRASFDGSQMSLPESRRRLHGSACPDCAGPLSVLEEGEWRHYRCEVGHTFTDHTLVEGQTEAIEGSLWVAIRSLEERARALEGIADGDRRAGRDASASKSVERAAESREHADRIRRMLTDRS